MQLANAQVCACGCGSDLKGSAILFPELVHELLLGNGHLVADDGEKGVCAHARVRAFVYTHCMRAWRIL